MPSQEEIQLCDTVENFNNILSYENDLKSRLHLQSNRKNDVIKSLPSDNGIRRIDNHGDHNHTTQQQRSEMVCVLCTMCAYNTCVRACF